MTLHDWGHKVIYVFYQRLTRKLSSHCPSVKKIGYVCVLHVCVCVHACMYPSILHLSLFDRNAAASTLTPQHTLSRQRVCQRSREKWSVSMLQQWTKGGRRWSPEKPEGGKKRTGKTERERDRYGRRLRGQIWEKVEWDIWKKERVIGTRRKLQLPNNDSLGKILFYISLSSNLST